MQRDSVLGTFAVATVLCVVCSLMVAAAAVGWRDAQERNAEIDKKKNVLLSAGLCEPSAEAAVVDGIFDERIREVMVDLSTGEEVEVGEDYDPGKAAKNPETQVPIQPSDALMGIRTRAPILPAYKIVAEDSEAVEGYIFPVEGKGLWSTLKGFLAIGGDGQEVMGITFYSHAETPGLGGEIDNPGWKALWPGKEIYASDGEVMLSVAKGAAPNEDAEPYHIDALSGATITSNGVDGIVKYWLGPEGFGEYLTSQTSAELGSGEIADEVLQQDEPER